MKKKLVVLTGAGISAESGVQTFRDSDGLWEGYNVHDVATPDGFARNPKLVLDFYNERRRQLQNVKPNEGHLILVELEKHFEVQIVTQNVDNLHEKAGSSSVLHLHGELLKACSIKNPNEFIDWHEDLNLGDLDENGDQLRPFIVWFGEDVPAIENAIKIVEQADVLIIIGTSLQVYPAASLMNFANPDIQVFYIDPNPANVYDLPNPLNIIKEKGSVGLKIVKEELIKKL